MSDSGTRFAGAIPDVYDRLLVPLLFEFYAQDLAVRVAKMHPRDVLETAAGTGALTRAITSRLPPQSRIIATDLNQPMLDRARARQADDSRIVWRQADALALPFADASFDVVLCEFGVMFFPDKIRAFQETLRVLRPGGCFLFNVWDRISENQFAETVTQALAELFPSNPPDFMSRVPHGYFMPEEIQRQLTAAGFTSSTVEVLSGTSRAATPLDAAVAFCHGTPMRNEIEARNPARLQDAAQVAAQALARRFGDGAIEGRMQALVFAAIR